MDKMMKMLIAGGAFALVAGYANVAMVAITGSDISVRSGPRRELARTQYRHPWTQTFLALYTFCQQHFFPVPWSLDCSCAGTRSIFIHGNKTMIGGNLPNAFSAMFTEYLVRRQTNVSCRL